MNDQFKKRLYSFLIRFGWFLLVAGVNWLSTNFKDLAISSVVWQGAIAYALGELSKYLNNKKLGKV